LVVRRPSSPFPPPPLETTRIIREDPQSWSSGDQGSRFPPSPIARSPSPMIREILGRQATKQARSPRPAWAHGETFLHRHPLGRQATKQPVSPRARACAPSVDAPAVYLGRQAEPSSRSHDSSSSPCASHLCILGRQGRPKQPFPTISSSGRALASTSWSSRRTKADIPTWRSRSGRVARPCPPSWSSGGPSRPFPTFPRVCRTER